jgi:hypothetical protein
MRDSSKTEAERIVQREFRKNWLIASALLVLGVLLFRAGLNRLPNRIELGPRTVPLHFEPVNLAAGSVGPFRIVASWRLFAADPRFGGISALAVDGPDLVALSDSGVVARFPKPPVRAAAVSLDDLPGGPGRAGFKVNRDSEALAAIPGGGWVVAFENRDELWTFDHAFTRALRRARIKGHGLSRNRGIEGMVADGRGLILFPESGGSAIRPGEKEIAAVTGLTGWISDAVRLPDGRILVANRRLTPIGLGNFLVVLRPDSGGYRAGDGWRVPVARLDNVEALAAEPLPGGGTRIWAMTDNNLQQRRPTLLIALELRPRPAR